MMHFRLVNPKILREFIFAIKELLRDRLKGIVKQKKVWWLFITSSRCEYGASPKARGPADIIML